MATVYRVVTLRSDGSMVGFDGPFHSPGTAKRVLRTVSAGLSPSNPSGGIKAEIQSLTGEWVSEARPIGFQKTPGFNPSTMLEPEMTRPRANGGSPGIENGLPEAMRARLAANPVDRLPDAGYTPQD